MLKVHHLNDSRSQRILWLLEELALPYEIVRYQRDAATRLAPAALKAIHPLGKSPALEDEGRIVIESGAIIEYVVRRHGRGALGVEESDPLWPDYLQWMHYAEGSAMLPLMLGLYSGMLGEAAAPLRPRIESETANHIGYIAGALGDKGFLVGGRLTAADIQVSFVLEAADMFGALGPYPNLTAYLRALQARPAYLKALERGGPYMFKR